MEIKEILDFKENADYKKLSCDEIAILKDYITNLQQENERLKTKTKEQSLLLIDYQDMEQKLENYKSRIEKAINKVQNIIDIGFDYDGYNDVDNLKILVDELVDLARQTKNILNGRSDE